MPIPQNEQEMFSNIHNYLDKLLSIVQPKSLLYLAIDGVAPRAKMNQQRSRRFRSGLDQHKSNNLKHQMISQLQHSTSQQFDPL